MGLYPDINEGGTGEFPQAQPVPAPAAQAQPAGQTAAEKPAAKDDGYGVGHAIVDMLSYKLGFGKPILQTQTLALQKQAAEQGAESHRVAMEQAEKKDMLDEAKKTFAQVLPAVIKTDSRYHKDLGHLADVINRSDKTRKFLGVNKLAVTPTGEKNAAGDEEWTVGNEGPDGQVAPLFKGTAQDAVDRFFGAQHPEVVAAIMGETAKKINEDEQKIATARKYESAEMGVKKALGIATTEYDKYLHLKQKFPDMDEWQLKEASGIKIEDRYKPIGTGPVPMSDDRLGVTVMDRNDGDKIKVIPLPGTTWTGYKARTKKETEHWKNLYWPDTDEDPAHEKKAKGIFGAMLDATEDPTEQRRLMTEVLPKFREWAELNPGEVDDGKGQMRKLTVGDMQKKLNELMGAGKAANADGKKNESPDDQGDWGFYRRGAKSRLSKLMAEETAAKNKPLQETQGGKEIKAAESKAAPAAGLYPDAAAGGRGRMTQPGSLAEAAVEKINAWGRDRRQAAAAQP